MICIAENSGGKGGVAGGAGAAGQASQSATGFGASDYGYPVIEVTTGQTTTVEVQLTKDYNGEIPANLTEIYSVIFKARPSMTSHSKEIKIDCCYTDTGKVELTFTPAEVNYNNGLWYAEFLCYYNDTLLQVYKAYLCIRKGMDGSTGGHNNITAMDVRMALMDTSQEANQLIDDLEFSDAMIYTAINRCIDEWNETPPEISKRYDATTFPYREHLIKGAVGYLMQMIAYRYTRNRMQYAASGVQLDTSDKGPQYVQLSQLARQEWKMFVAAKKTEHNMQDCFGTVELPYFGSGAW